METNTNQITQLLEELKDFSPLTSKDEAIEAYEQDVVLKLTPQAVFRPSTKEELQRIIKTCNKYKVPYTPCGSQTSVTGGSVTDQGILISFEKMNKVLQDRPCDYDENCRIISSQPGIILADFQREVEKIGYYYPPDPTSWEEVQLGGSVATNATGENSYHYGSTRNYIQALEIIDSQGEMKRLEREIDPRTLSRRKNFAGYEMSGKDLDAWIGSEGSLGLIAEIEVLAIAKPAAFTSLFIFFEQEVEALAFTCSVNENREELNLRCLEIMDHAATELMREKSDRFQIPPNCCTIYLKIEDLKEEHFESLMESYEESAQHGKNHFEGSLVASDHLELLEFRRLRHHIPATINEISARNKETGGGKVSSDWWVPLPELQGQFQFLREELSRLPVKAIAFGHIGNGHPHVNLMPETADQKEAALEFTKACMRRAAQLGGGVCGEHGLGKIKTWALDIQWDEQEINSMRKMKEQWDPEYLASPGNLFERKNND